MDENDPIYQAIDSGGLGSFDVAGVVRGLAKAGYVIRKWASADVSTQEQALEVVRALAEAHGANNGETIDRTVIRIAAEMWINTIRAEWQAYVDADPELKAQHEVALELMKEDGYGLDRMAEPICMLPGMKPMIAKVDNQEAVCVDYCMAQVMPLSSIYVNRVRLVQSAAARVAKRLAEEAAKEPPSWPITIASGETFNSIEEMEASPIDAVKDMAKMMKDAGMFACHPGFRAPEAQTCWQYFGFDGPTYFENLVPKYQKAMKDADAKLAQEVQRQYQNCLRELGTAIMNGEANE